MEFNFTIPDTGFVDWKKKYDEAIEDNQKLKVKFGIADSALATSRAQTSTAYADRDEAKFFEGQMQTKLRQAEDELEEVKKELEEVKKEVEEVKKEVEDTKKASSEVKKNLEDADWDIENLDLVVDQLRKENDKLKSEIEQLTSPEAEDEDSLSDDESVASEPSEETETSPSYEDSSFQTRVVSEEPVTMSSRDAETIAGLNAEIEKLRKNLNSEVTELKNKEEYIKYTENQAVEFKKKYEDEQKVSAALKQQLDNANLDIKRREENITGENGYEQQIKRLQESIENDLKPELTQGIGVNKKLKEDLDIEKREVEHWKNKAADTTRENVELLKENEQFKKQAAGQDKTIKENDEKVGQAIQLAKELDEHQRVLGEYVTDMNKAIEDGPKFNPHPEAYINLELNSPVSQTLSGQLPGISASDESSLFEEYESDSSSDHGAEAKDAAKSEEALEIEKEEIAKDLRILNHQLRQVELVKAPVEEITVAKSPVQIIPAAPKVIIKKVNRIIYKGRDIHSWSHIERDFLVLVLAFFNYLTGILWPSLLQEVRGIAPISDHPVQVPAPGDDEEPQAADLPGPASIPVAFAMMNSAHGTSRPELSVATNAGPQGHDPVDSDVGADGVETANLADLLPPLSAHPDTREIIDLAPPASRPSASSHSVNAGMNPNSQYPPTGDGNGDRSGPPGPSSGDGNGSSPSNTPHGDGNGGPPGPPGHPNGDGFGDLLPAEAPGFWNIFAPRPLPSIKWTLTGMILHLVVYYCAYLTIDTYYERKLWLAANDATRQLLIKIMDTQYSSGFLRKILSENWARRIDKSLFYAVTRTGFMELKTYPIPG